VDTLAEELPATPSDPFASQVEVWVMNNGGGAGDPAGMHEVFVENKARLERHRKGRYFHFVDNPHNVKDPTDPNIPDPDDDNNPTNRPGRYVRQQTCDVIALIRTVAPRARYFMFMEDDFETCTNAIHAVHYAVLKAERYSPQWLALRVSYGLNGIVMKSADALKFADFLWQHVSRLPPDLLYAEFRQQLQGGRPLMAYRFNLFNHIGSVSSLPRPNRPAFPKCGEELVNVWSLSGEESFDIGACSADDISPCPHQAGVPALIDWRTSCTGAPAPLAPGVHLDWFRL